MGTVKGLAYLHEDCLDWILHCDVKPQNILLELKLLTKGGRFWPVKVTKQKCS